MLKETDYICYFNSLLNGDKKECIKTADRLLAEGISIKDIYIKLLQRSMYRIGTLCERNKLAIANERIATDITKNIIDLIYPHVILNTCKGPKILITCIDKEHHSIGPRIVSDFFELNGWCSIFLGANVPCCEIIACIEKNKPHVVGISSNFYLNLNRLIKFIEEINSRIPKQEIIIGGQVFSKGGEELIRGYKNVKYIDSMKELEKFIKAKGQKFKVKKERESARKI